MGSSGIGDGKVESAAYLEKLREPVRASDRRTARSSCYINRAEARSLLVGSE